jgi:hypothetical protein
VLDLVGDPQAALRAMFGSAYVRATPKARDPAH